MGGWIGQRATEGRPQQAQRGRAAVLWGLLPAGQRRQRWRPHCPAGTERRQGLRTETRARGLTLTPSPPPTTVQLLSGGRLIFHGPRELILPFFCHLGFECPDDKGDADFLQEVSTYADQRVRAVEGTQKRRSERGSSLRCTAAPLPPPCPAPAPRPCPARVLMPP